MHVHPGNNHRAASTSESMNAIDTGSLAAIVHSGLRTVGDMGI